MALSNPVMFAVIITTASTLGTHGDTGVPGAAWAAGGPRPRS
jgi:hypothetical protein